MIRQKRRRFFLEHQPLDLNTLFYMLDECIQGRIVGEDTGFFKFFQDFLFLFFIYKFLFSAPRHPYLSVDNSEIMKMSSHILITPRATLDLHMIKIKNDFKFNIIMIYACMHIVNRCTNYLQKQKVPDLKTVGGVIWTKRVLCWQPPSCPPFTPF